MGFGLGAALGGVGAGLGSLVGGLLFPKKQANVNDQVNEMTNLTNTHAKTQQDLANALYTSLQPLGTQYQKASDTLGLNYVANVGTMGQDYANSLNAVGASDILAADKAKKLNAAQTYASIPLAQQTIRQNLGASGNLRSGAAAKALMAPTTNAMTNVSQYGQGLDINNLNKVSDRQVQGINAVYSGKMGAALTKLGIDRDTMTTLLQNGRTDLISRASSLMGIDQNQLQNLLGIQGINANVALANIAQHNDTKQSQSDAFSSIFGGAATAGGNALDSYFTDKAAKKAAAAANK